MMHLALDKHGKFTSSSGGTGLAEQEVGFQTWQKVGK